MGADWFSSWESRWKERLPEEETSVLASVTSPPDHDPKTVKEVIQDFKHRQGGIIKALTSEFHDFFLLCDPEIEQDLCLYSLPSVCWEVGIPSYFLQGRDLASFPKPAVGINICRDSMSCQDWLEFVSTHSDSWLLSVAYYFCAPFDETEKKQVFDAILDLPTVLEVVEEEKETLDEDDNSEDFCALCGGRYKPSEFWIQCDSCDKWFHGKCVEITPDAADRINNYVCPLCAKIAQG